MANCLSGNGGYRHVRPWTTRQSTGRAGARVEPPEGAYGQLRTPVLPAHAPLGVTRAAIAALVKAD